MQGVRSSSLLGSILQNHSIARDLNGAARLLFCCPQSGLEQNQGPERGLFYGRQAPPAFLGSLQPSEESVPSRLRRLENGLDLQFFVLNRPGSRTKSDFIARVACSDESKRTAEEQVRRVKGQNRRMQLQELS